MTRRDHHASYVWLLLLRSWRIVLDIRRSLIASKHSRTSAPSFRKQKFPNDHRLNAMWSWRTQDSDVPLVKVSMISLASLVKLGGDRRAVHGCEKSQANQIATAPPSRRFVTMT